VHARASWAKHDEGCGTERRRAIGNLTAHAKAVVEAFNSDDWDAARRLLGDSTYNELGTPRSLTGGDAIIEAVQGWKAAMPS
jgi:hypothetical protein